MFTKAGKKLAIFIAICLLTFLQIYIVQIETLMHKIIPKQLIFNEAEAHKKCDYLNRGQPDHFTVQINGEVYPKRVPLYENKSINMACLQQQKAVKTILLWTKFKGLPYIPELGKDVETKGFRQIFKDYRCPIDNCALTFNRSMLNESAMILFHLRNHIDYYPQYRGEDQHWVHVINENPVHCHKCVTEDRLFNLSSTYTRDSDFSSIYWTDSGLYWAESNPEYTSKDAYSNKTKFGAALISSCLASSEHRLKYIRELQKYIPIDIYGKCGDHPCPQLPINCREFITSQYKFFFVFENTMCRDYITEKFFDTMKYDIIPVVLAGDIRDYKFYLPSSGYINALDFETPKLLAEFLAALGSDKSRYNTYFEWKKYLRYNSEHPIQGFLCEMCIKLQMEAASGVVEHKSLQNMKSRFGMVENCQGMSTTKSFKYEKGQNLGHSFFMSPE